MSGLYRFEEFGVLERLSSAVIQVDGRRRIGAMNRRAEALFSVGEGLTVRNNHLYFAGAADRKLAELLARATGAERGGRRGGVFPVPRVQAPTPLSVSVSPLHEPAGVADPEPLALVLISDPEEKLRVSTDGLRSLYDLTPAEARLLAALCTGESISDVAFRTGNSITTMKSHLAAIFMKTGERRQADLLLRIARDQALLSAF